MFQFPFVRGSLLGALLRNESGGKNVANTHQGTSSGQAQGYFQITTGTWNEFGGRKYAPTPMGASYAQQAEIASKIPLSRWDKSTLSAMRGTGRPIDPRLTLGANLNAAGETFGSQPNQNLNQLQNLYQPHGIPATATGAAVPAAAPDVSTMTSPTSAPGSVAQPGSPATAGPTVTPGGNDPNAPPPAVAAAVNGQPAAPQDSPAVAAGKKLGGVLGELQKNAGGGEPTKFPEWRQGGGGAPSPTLAELIQQWVQQSQGMGQVVTPQQGQGQGGPRFG